MRRVQPQHASVGRLLASRCCCRHLPPALSRAACRIASLCPISCSYLNFVIKESMRLVSVVPSGTARQTDRELVLRGYRVPPGTLLLIGGLGEFGLLQSDRL